MDQSENHTSSPPPLSSPPTLPPLLDGLTEAQCEAVSHGDGAMLVVAAAGSGKTLVITKRIALLVASGVPAWSILALTFTNKAAEEMRLRVETLLSESGEGNIRGLQVSTFHRFCARFLRQYGEAVGLDRNYTIYDSSDQKSLMKNVIKSLDLSTSNFPPEAMLSAISQAKNALRGPDAMVSANQGGSDFWFSRIVQCYKAYEKALRARDAVDFDDLLLLTARVLREHDDIREAIQQRFQYLLIDEYQDTNHAQFMIAHTISAQHRNLFVVGDPDQSIYAWRGADISNILEFQENYPKAQVVKLGENFRSTAPILAIADRLIQYNKQRHEKPLYTNRKGGDEPRVLMCFDEHKEAETLVDEFLELSGEHGVPWRNMAVFYRINSLSRVIETTLRDRGIPYRIVRGTAFYDRKEIKDALAYLRVFRNVNDDVSLKRIINTPTRGIGATSLARVEAWASGQGIGLFEALRRVSEMSNLTARATRSIRDFVKMVESWHETGEFMGQETSGTLADLVRRIIIDSGLEAYYQKMKNADEEDRLSNLYELISSAWEFDERAESSETLDDEFDIFAERSEDESNEETTSSPLLDRVRRYLDHVSLVSDVDALDPDAGAVQLMTLHAAKGLEFDVVGMIGLEEGLLPHSRALESDIECEEERRLCFVGITRAKRHLYMTHAMRRTLRGVSEMTIASRFLRECGAISDHPEVDRDVTALHDEHNPRSAPGIRDQRFMVGARVRHPQFGIGEVLACSGTGRMMRVRIRFNQAGAKTIIPEYVRLEVL